MKILYCGGFALPDKNAAAQRVMGNAKLLRELGHEVILLGVEKNDSGFGETKKIDNCYGFEAYVTHYPSSQLELLKYYLNTESVFSVLKKNQDVELIICYNMQAIPLKKIIRYSNQNNIRIVNDITEWYTDTPGSLLVRIAKRLDSEYRMRILNFKVDGLIVISNYLRNFYCKKQKTVKLPPLIDIDDVKWSKTSKEDTGKLRVLYSGSSFKGKDRVDLILKALQRVKDTAFHLDIVGMAYGEFINLFGNKEIDGQFIKERVTFQGRHSHEESLEQLKASDLFIFIREKTKSNNAGFPTKFAEACTCGIPIATTETSDIDEYLNDESIQLDILDLENLNDSVNKVLKRAVIKNNYSTQPSKKFDYRQYKELLQLFLEDVGIAGV